ncbi:glycosyl hydrolase 115 family protein [Aestuariibacter sp. GS-14]|uniref:glycosyl hydrolase 115 family protein n=1 Tax=Aestuariibacter sp. GS-14 TaxID=2590670 RepID=UPI0021085922|nr:glycosyl hydrolase 115 family protein [Aestuariibacter sp. GS-14]
MLKQCFVLIVSLVSAIAPAMAYVSFSSESAGEHPFVVAEQASGRVATIWVDRNAAPGILLAAKSLQSDIQKVTGLQPAIIHEENALSGHVILVGERGASAPIDRLIASGVLAVEADSNQWEGYQLANIQQPFGKIEQAWVISGFDRRGVIYGIYDLSDKIGVSPWYWWADVPIVKREGLYINEGTQVNDAPKVKYRGIFLNDEAPALTNWTQEKFGGYNAAFYQHVFELLLRLKANFLWPAMWNNAFADDDPQNMYLAHEMGIVMSTSHHEPMMRADKEWNRYGSGPWEYSTNPDKLYQFWVEGAKRYKDKDAIFTMGMRGQADTPMSEGENIGLLERIVADQREILAKHINKPIDDIPQVWALYKEVQGFYERGMRVPDDVTLLWADDNFGNVRRLPTSGELTRKGGAGVYYHFDYVGGPRSYRWINTVPLGKVWEQMNLAWEYGADRIWITNVGDLKPMELPISFFLAQAWNPAAFNESSPATFTREWVHKQFNGQFTDDITHLLNTYTLHNGRRKPAAIAPDTYSVLNYSEASRVSAELADAATLAGQIYDQLDGNYRDSFFQLVGYPLWASQALFELNHAQALNRLYADQDRSTTNEMAASVNGWFARDEQLRDAYHGLREGKWNHMMSQPHIGFVHWRNPPANLPPVVHTKALAVPAVADMGVAVEGSRLFWPANEGMGKSLSLPKFTPYGEASRLITVYNRQGMPFDWKAKPSHDWIRVSETSGNLTAEQQISVSIDWQTLPPGEHSGTVLVTGTGWGGASIEVSAVKPAITETPQPGDFIEGDGYISANATSALVLQGSAGEWRQVALHGRTGEAMRAAIPPHALLNTGNAPALQFPLYFTSAGEFELSLQLSPSLPFDTTTGIQLAVALDDALLGTVNMPEEAKKKAWEQGVLDNVKTLTITFPVNKAGRHTLTVYGLTPGAVLQKILIDTGDLQPSYLGPIERRYKL